MKRSLFLTIPALFIVVLILKNMIETTFKGSGSGDIESVFNAFFTTIAYIFLLIIGIFLLWFVMAGIYNIFAKEPKDNNRISTWEERHSNDPGFKEYKEYRKNLKNYH